MNTSHISIIGALLALLAVAFGAFGAHMLKPRISPELFGAFETGTRYQMYHALGMLLAGMALRFQALASFRYAAWLFLLGIILFSGSLYVLALTGIRGLGAVTPLGGLCFLLGWALLAKGYYQWPTQKPDANTSSQ